MQLIRFCKGSKEAVVVDSIDLTEEQAEKTYELPVGEIKPLKGDELDWSGWPLDILLET